MSKLDDATTRGGEEERSSTVRTPRSSSTFDLDEAIALDDGEAPVAGEEAAVVAGPDPDLDPGVGDRRVLDVELDDEPDDLAGEHDEHDEHDELEDDVDHDDASAPAGTRPQSRRRRRKEWRRVERARRYAARRSVRFPIFTRSVLLWLLLFALVGISTGASAAFFWAHFNTQISELREQTSDFEKRSSEAQAQIETMRNQALNDIDTRLRPLASDLATPRIIQNVGGLSPYVWFVATLDENGNPSVGTAFTVTSDDKTAMLVTSLYTVRTSTVSPAPDIELRKNDDVIKARLINWDAARDLALLSVDRGGLPILDWATDDEQSKLLGTRVFPVSGLGGGGASATDGLVVDQSAAGFLHDAAIGAAFQGGPIINVGGKVVGVASTAYRPLGFDPGQTHYSIPVNQVCQVLLECGGGMRKPKK